MKEPFALKNELKYQKHYVEDMVKATAKQPAVNAIYEHWLQFTKELIKICEERNRY